jgi:hypothetical protein
MFYAFDKDDAIIKDFLKGVNGEYDTWENIKNGTIDNNVVIRGMTERKVIHECWQKNRNFYYIDTGYIGNLHKKKWLHRVVKNNVQHTTYTAMPADRYQRLCAYYPEVNFHGWKPEGKNILLVTPSEKPCKFYNITRDDWIKSTTETLKKYTDRPIVVRDKGLRRDRIQGNSLWAQLDKDNIYAVVTYQSIAAIESICHGVPAFTLAPTAADSMTLKDLSQIEKPLKAEATEVKRWLCWLAYCQYSVAEFQDGTANKIIQDYNLK